MGVARASFQFLVEEEAIRQLTGYAHLSLAVELNTVEEFDDKRCTKAEE